MKMFGANNFEKTKHFEFPLKNLRYSVIEGLGTETEKFYLKVVGFKDRIQVSKETFDKARSALEELN